MQQRASVAGGAMRPLFFERLRRKDLETVVEQMAGRKFDERILLGIAARCPLGAPSVLLCRPLFQGKPFPTTFWLTCPHAVKTCDGLEAQGGVAGLESFLAHEAYKWRDYGLRHSFIRLAFISSAERKFLSARRKQMWEKLRKGRIGGTLDTGHVRVKCLHLQTASWLALGYHPGEEWLKGRIPAACPPGSGYPCRKGRDLSR